MATVIQAPNKWNVAYAKNVYTLGNLGANDRFVLQIKIDGNIVSTFKQPQNPSGVAHFDVSRVLQSYLGSSFVEETPQMSETPNVALKYSVDYGYELNGSVYIDGTYTNDEGIYQYVINGYDNWKVLNWDYVDFIPNPMGVACLCEAIDCVPFVNAVYNRSYEYLTNWPTRSESGYKKYKVRSDEYKTLSFFNRIYNWSDGNNWGPNESPFFAKYTYYNAAGSLIAIDIDTIDAMSGLPNRTDCTDNTPIAHTNAQLIGTVGVGPQNIKNSSIYWAPNAASYTVEIYSLNVCQLNDVGPIDDCEDEALLSDYLGDLLYRADFVIEDKCTKFDPITVSFMNQYGVKDYYTFDRRNTYTSGIQRSNYSKIVGSWNASNFTIDEHSRGRTTFNSSSTTLMSLTTDWMTDDESKWLEELYTSPDVYIYYKGAWEPVVITSTDYQQKTYARDKMFQHSLEIQFSNDKQTQRG